MSEDRSDFQPTFEAMVRAVAGVLETASKIEHHVSDILDKQIVNRLLSQYDKLVKTGFSHQEALDAVINLVRRRLETASQERSQ